MIAAIELIQVFLWSPEGFFFMICGQFRSIWVRNRFYSHICICCSVTIILEINIEMG